LCTVSGCLRKWFSEGRGRYADRSRLITRTEHIYQPHKSSGMAPVSISTLAPEIQFLICDYLSIDCLTKVALTCKAQKHVIYSYKASYNAKISTYAVELSFFDSRFISGWLCPSKARLMRLKDWVKRDLLVFHHDERFGLRPNARWSEIASRRRQKEYTNESVWYLGFLKGYSKRYKSYAKWLTMMSHARNPSVQWDLDSLYEALLLWSTTDWPGVANVMVKVVESGGDRSLAQLPLTLQQWLDRAT